MRTILRKWNSEILTVVSGDLLEGFFRGVDVECSTKPVTAKNQKQELQISPGKKNHHNLRSFLSASASVFTPEGSPRKDTSGSCLNPIAVEFQSPRRSAVIPQGVSPKGISRTLLNPAALNFQSPSQTSKRKTFRSTLNPAALSFELLKTFPRFTELPTKVRNMIWKHARPGSRLIRLKLSKDLRSIISTAPVSALLQTCKVSRAFLQQCHLLLFPGPDGVRRVYFDLQRDAIWSGCAGCYGNSCGHQATWTLHHELVRGLVYEGPLSLSPFTKIAKLFPKVVELTLIRVGTTETQKREGVIELKGWESDEPFEWQRGTLTETYYREIEQQKLGPVDFIKLVNARRVNLSGVQEVEPAKSALNYWACA